jgi:hypothetical protein
MVDEDMRVDDEDGAPTSEQIENRYWKRALGTTDLAARGYRSFWD